MATIGTSNNLLAVVWNISFYAGIELLVMEALIGTLLV